MPLTCDDQHKRDVQALAQVAEIDATTVRGFTLVLYTDTGEAVTATNACCSRHALDDLACLVEHRAPDLAPCSGEQ